jgi:hypothetical protein
MPKSGIKHIDVGPELTKTEWESEESHEVVHGTSFPSSPVERQLFYRDDEHKWYIYNGTDWVWLGGGAGGGMQVHGNEYHDPNFATESALSAAKPKIILDVYLYNDGTNQQLPGGPNVVVMLDTEVTDSENAFDSSVKAGTATATSAGHLIDTTLNPFVPGDVGRKVWNTTDDTYTYITAYNSASDVSVNDDIFTSGEGYKAYFAKFVAPSPMEVVVFTKVDVRYLADGKYLQLQILKNGSTAASELRYFSGASQLGLINMSSPIILAAGDYLQLVVAHNVGSKQYITAASGGATWMRIVKLRDL